MSEDSAAVVLKAGTVFEKLPVGGNFLEMVCDPDPTTYKEQHLVLKAVKSKSRIQKESKARLVGKDCVHLVPPGHLEGPGGRGCSQEVGMIPSGLAARSLHPRPRQGPVLQWVPGTEVTFTDQWLSTTPSRLMSGERSHKLSLCQPQAHLRLAPASHVVTPHAVLIGIFKSRIQPSRTSSAGAHCC